MTVLVFGRTGQVARELQSVAPVIALGRDQADLTNLQACRDAIEAYAPTAVINAAAYTAVDDAEREEDLASQVNGAAPRAMAEVCASRDIPFVHISTDYVFSGNGNAAWRPDDQTEPCSAYGRSKLIGEKNVRAAGGRFAILRTSWVFSQYGNNFLKTMLKLANERQELRVVSDQIGGPTPAAAIASACLTIAEQLRYDPDKSGVFHFSGEANTSWSDFARHIFVQAKKEVVVHDIPTSDYTTLAVRPMNSRLNCQTTSKVFGVEQPSWRDATSRILRELGAK